MSKTTFKPAPQSTPSSSSAASAYPGLSPSIKQSAVRLPRVAPTPVANPYSLSGPLRYIIPIGFLIGAGIELFMNKVPIGGQTFYDVAKRKRAERLLEKERAIMEYEQHVRDRKERILKKRGVTTETSAGSEPTVPA